MRLIYLETLLRWFTRNNKDPDPTFSRLEGMLENSSFINGFLSSNHVMDEVSCPDNNIRDYTAAINKINKRVVNKNNIPNSDTYMSVSMLDFFTVDGRIGGEDKYLERWLHESMTFVNLYDQIVDSDYYRRRATNLDGVRNTIVNITDVLYSIYTENNSKDI